MSLKTIKLWGICNIDIETERQKTERQKENETKDDELDSEDIQATSNDLLRSEKGGWGGGGGMSSRFFDRLNSMIYDLKISVDLR